MENTQCISSDQPHRESSKPNITVQSGVSDAHASANAAKDQNGVAKQSRNSASNIDIGMSGLGIDPIEGHLINGVVKLRQEPTMRSKACGVTKCRALLRREGSLWVRDTGSSTKSYNATTCHESCGQDIFLLVYATNDVLHPMTSL